MSAAIVNSYDAQLSDCLQNCVKYVKDITFDKWRKEYRICLCDSSLYGINTKTLFNGFLEIYSINTAKRPDAYFIYIPRAGSGFFCTSYEYLTKERNLTGSTEKSFGDILKVCTSKGDFYLSLERKPLKRENIRYEFELNKWPYEDILGFRDFIKDFYEKQNRACLKRFGKEFPEIKKYNAEYCLNLAKTLIACGGSQIPMIDEENRVHDINLVKAYLERTTA